MKSVPQPINSDTDTLKQLGYTQELDRRMSGFSNFAISFSIICILSGGLTSFHLGFSAVGGAAIGIGWPVGCTLALVVAATMGQLASAFPTAGGLYHWAAILGGRCWGWITAWFNLAGLIAALAAINVGTFLFAVNSIGKIFGINWENLPSNQQFLMQACGVTLITVSQGIINDRGIRLTTLLTDFSGYLILAVSFLLTATMLICTSNYDFTRLITFTNYSGIKGGDVWPLSNNLGILFALGLLLPAYTITGFDASAHTSEETLAAQTTVPRGIIRSVLISGLAGWLMLAAMILAMPSLDQAASQGPNVFFWLLDSVAPKAVCGLLLSGIILAQYLCGLATVTSASRMTYAFARDGGLPFSKQLKKINSENLTPSASIWTIVALSCLFTFYTPVYSTISVVCVIFLYISYVIPAGLGFFAHGRAWHNFGPWNLGIWFKPAGVISVLGGLLLILIGVQPPNDKALVVLGGTAIAMTAIWFGLERKRFIGPPPGVMNHLKSHLGRE